MSHQSLLLSGYFLGDYQESYDDLEANLETITNDFLRFANEFNQIPTAYFELEPSRKSY
ncbi:hypothetical protein ID0983_05240 [Helicobacter pylori]